MSISSEDARALLISNPGAYQSFESLTNLAKGLSVEDASGASTAGKVTVLYSGRLAPGVSAEDAAKALAASNEKIRIISLLTISCVLAGGPGGAD